MEEKRRTIRFTLTEEQRLRIKGYLHLMEETERQGIPFDLVQYMNIVHKEDHPTDDEEPGEPYK